MVNILIFFLLFILRFVKQSTITLKSMEYGDMVFLLQFLHFRVVWEFVRPGNPTNFLSNREMLESSEKPRVWWQQGGGCGWPGLQGGGRLPHLKLPVSDVCCNIPLVQGPPTIPQATHEHQESDEESGQEERKLTEG